MTPKQKKILYWGGGAIAAYLVLSKLTGSENGGPQNDPTGNGDVADASSGGYVFNAHNVATKLWECMHEMGTDEAGIIAALKPVSQSNFGKVIAAFGELAYNPTTGNQVFGWWEEVQRHDLPYWLKSELSDSNYNTLRNKYPNYL